MIRRVNRRELLELNADDVCFISLAESGAMGFPGTVNFITKDACIYQCNYMYGDIKTQDIMSSLPMLDKCKFGLFGIDSKVPNGWNYVNLGAGNHLIVRDDVYKEFMKRKGDIEEPCQIYGKWMDWALDIN